MFPFQLGRCGPPSNTGLFMLPRVHAGTASRSVLQFCTSHTHSHHLRTQTHTHSFNGPFPRTTRVSRYQKGITNLDFTVARDSEWQWHQLGHMQVCTSLETDNHASTPTTQFFTGRMLFLLPNQQRQSTEGTQTDYSALLKLLCL